MSMCLHGHVSAGIHAGQKRISNPLQLKSSVATENQTQVLCKSSTHSLPLSHLFRPQTTKVVKDIERFFL